MAFTISSHRRICFFMTPNNRIILTRDWVFTNAHKKRLGMTIHYMYTTLQCRPMAKLLKETVIIFGACITAFNYVTAYEWVPQTSLSIDYYTYTEYVIKVCFVFCICWIQRVKIHNSNILPPFPIFGRIFLRS